MFIESSMQKEINCFDFAGLARENVFEMLPYVPGKSILEMKEEYNLNNVVELSSNECPLDLPSGLGKAVSQSITGNNRYPDALCKKLKAKVAKKLKVQEDNLIFGNGAEECIRLIAQTLLNHGDMAVIPTPIFEAYSIATRLMGAKELCVPLKDHHIDLELILQVCEQNSRVKLVWLCSPSNPTGDILKKHELDSFLARLPRNIMVVLDEAYAEFVTDKKAAHTACYLDKDPRVIGLRTFSKAYGLAGFRVGYIIAHPEIINLVNNVRLPFSVNSLALAAAEYMLDEETFVKKHVALVVQERKFMQAELAKRGLDVLESQANFLFVKLPPGLKKNGIDIFKMMMPKGFVVRPGSAFGVPEYFRMSLGSREDNLMFLQEFDRLLS